MPCTICHNSEKFRIQFTLNNKVRTFQNPKTSFDPFSASCFSSFCSSPKSSNTDVLMNFCNPPSQPTKPNQTNQPGDGTPCAQHSASPSSCPGRGNTETVSTVGWTCRPNSPWPCPWRGCDLHLTDLKNASVQEVLVSGVCFGKKKKNSKRIHFNSILNV